MENQIRRSRLVILNKVDRVKDTMVKLLIESVKQINPDVQVYPTRFGRLEPAILQEMLQAKTAWQGRLESPQEAEHEPEENHDHGLADEYQTFGKALLGLFDKGCLETFFDDLKNQHYGEIVRAKGIFRTYRNWVKLELASGEVRVEEGPEGTHSVVSVVGRLMNTQEMEAGLSGCREE
jgi:G3E family GTPase